MNQSENKRDLISKMYTNAANLKHIAQTGIINGSLLIDIEKAMEAYANQRTASLIQTIENRIAELEADRLNCINTFNNSHYVKMMDDKLTELRNLLTLIKS